MESYVQAFDNARQFSQRFGPEDGRRPSRAVDTAMWPFLVNRAQQLAPDSFDEMKKQTDQFWAFGTSCGDVHWHVVQRLRKNFLESFELTIGGVSTASGAGFPYTEKDFHAHEAVKPNRFMGHAWITCGNRFIIDLTLGTYLVNLEKRCHRYGQIIHGEPGALTLSEFENGLAPPTDLTYFPVAVGAAALNAISPSRDNWAKSRSAGQKTP